MRVGTVTLTGRPNVGKSSLINAVLKTKASIVTPKPQTTRNSIRCIYNDEDSQIIFTDTPGFFDLNKDVDGLNAFLKDSIMKSLEECDLICWLVDSRTRILKNDDIETAKLLSAGNTPVILVINKSDLGNSDVILKLFSGIFDFKAVVKISAKFNKNLDEFLKIVKGFIPEGELLYDPEILIDSTERFVASEVIREKMLLLLRDEVPHSSAVEIDEYKSPDEYENRKNLYIRASLITETEGQKAILIGSNGSMIKKIGSLSRNELEKITGYKVFLDLWVKVLPHWRKNNLNLKRLGYV